MRALQHGPFSRTKPPAGSQVDWSHPLTRGLVGLWCFNEGSGQLVGDVALNHPGTTEVNLVAGSVSWAPGGMRFDPANRHCLAIQSAGSQLDAIVDVFTIEGIAARAASGALHTLGSRNTGGWDCRYETTNTFSLLKDNTSAIATTTRAITDLGSHHLVATKSGADVHLYIDGRDYTGTVTNATMTAPGGVWYIARNTSKTTVEFWNGTISKFSVYNRALTPGEILQLYNEPFSMLRGPDVYRR